VYESCDGCDNDYTTAVYTPCEDYWFNDTMTKDTVYTMSGSVVNDVVRIDRNANSPDGSYNVYMDALVNYKRTATGNFMMAETVTDDVTANRYSMAACHQNMQ